MEGFKPKARNKIEAPTREAAPADFSTFLGEGFDNEFFVDKTRTFPYAAVHENWNTFLRGEGLAVKGIETDRFTEIVRKLSGTADAPLLFPVFVQGLQDYYRKKGIDGSHVTPERMQRFYDYMCGSEEVA